MNNRINIETARFNSRSNNCGNRPPEYDNGQNLGISLFQKNSPKGMCVKCLGKILLRL